MPDRSSRYLSVTFLFVIFMMLFLNLYQIAIQEIEEMQRTENVTINTAFLKTTAMSIAGQINQADYGRHEIIELYGWLQRVLGNEYIIDAEPSRSIIKLKNNYLTFPTLKIAPQKIEAAASNLAHLNNKLKTADVPLLYIQAPSKVDLRNEQLPDNIEYYQNVNVDMLLKNLKELDVDFLDLRAEIEKQQLDHYELFFRTDHHWTPEAAFWAFENVSLYLSQNYNFRQKSEITNIENYNKKVFEDYFLGSQGKRIGTQFVGVDDITLITPKFETNLSIDIPSKKIDKSGSYIDTLIFPEHIEVKDYYSKNPYAMYMGGDFPLVHVINHDVDTKKILLVRDSFSCPFSAFLSLSVHELDIIDLRYYEDGSLSEYIEASKPDLVMFMYNPSTLGYDETDKNYEDFWNID